MALKGGVQCELFLFKFHRHVLENSKSWNALGGIRFYLTSCKRMKVTVKPTPRLGQGQKGLFSKRPIQKGEMVVSMSRKNLAKYSKKRWGEIHKASRQLPHDGAIEARGKMVTDWTTGRTPT